MERTGHPTVDRCQGDVFIANVNDAHDCRMQSDGEHTSSMSSEKNCLIFTIAAGLSKETKVWG